MTQIQRDKMTEANRNRMRKAQRDGKSAFMLGFSLFLSLIYSATVVLNLQSDRKPPEETGSRSLYCCVVAAALMLIRRNQK